MLTLQGNLVNLHSGKYSGLANNKVIDISAGPDGAITVTKVQADGGKVASTKRQSTLRRSTGPRRANKIAAVETAHKGFRPDLRQVSTLCTFQRERSGRYDRRNLSRTRRNPHGYPMKVGCKRNAKVKLPRLFHCPAAPFKEVGLNCAAWGHFHITAFML